MSNQLLETLFYLADQNASTKQLKDIATTTTNVLTATSINIQTLGVLIVEANVRDEMIGHLVADLGRHTQDLLTLKKLVDDALIERDSHHD